MLLRLKVGKWLATRPLRKGDLARIAGKLGVKVRSLLNWRQAAGQPLKRQGRPPATHEERRIALVSVAWLVKRQGWGIGWRCLVLSLPWVSTRLLQWALARLKARKCRLDRRCREQQRWHHRYTAQGVVLAQDTAHVGSWKGGKVYSEVLLDPATNHGEAAGHGSKPTAITVVGYLQLLKSEGRLPLVHQTDNDAAYCAHQTARWRKENKVIHLRSRPHTPQDNPAVESYIGEVKHSYFTLGEGNYYQAPQQGVYDVAQITDRLNTFHQRLLKGGKTADQLTREVPRWNITVSRDEFYKAACKAIETATLGLKGRQSRTAEREAIFQTLELFGLLVRSRGDGGVC